MENYASNPGDSEQERADKPRVMSPLPASGSLWEGEERPVSGRQDQRPGNIPTFLSSCIPFRYNLKECTCHSASTVACIIWLG